MPFRKQLFRGIASTGALQRSVCTDRNENFAIYIRDKMPSARELHKSGLRAALRERLEENAACSSPGCTLCPALGRVIDDTIAFAEKGRFSAPMRKLRKLVTGTGGV